MRCLIKHSTVSSITLFGFPIPIKLGWEKVKNYPFFGTRVFSSSVNGQWFAVYFDSNPESDIHLANQIYV
jgi:hypothetical protein